MNANEPTNTELIERLQSLLAEAAAAEIPREELALIDSALLWLPWAISGAMVVFIAALLIYWFFRRRSNRPGEAAIPPYHHALAEIRRVRTEALQSGERAPDVLARAVRHYFAVFEKGATAATTTELRRRLQRGSNRLDEPMFSTVVNILEVCDARRFAVPESTNESDEASASLATEAESLCDQLRVIEKRMEVPKR